MEALPARYLRARAYLQSLPAGLDSFPECRVRAEVYTDVRESFPELGKDTSLPPRVSAYFKGHHDKQWISEVLGQVINLLARDSLPGDDAFLDYTYGLNQRLFQSSFLRHLMRLVTPTLIVMGAAQRWGTLHEGTTLTAGKIVRKSDGNRTTGTLHFPAGLYPELFLRALVPAFRAGIDGARAEHAEVRLVRVEPTLAEYEIAWR